jgi:serine/threonine-protein kinase RIO1
MVILIDFPQVTSSLGNHKAYDILRRDVLRTCEYFAGQGVVCDAAAIADDLWQRCVESGDREQLAYCR